MRQLRTGGCVIALLGLLGLATACASAPVSPAGSGARDTAITTSAAPAGAVAGHSQAGAAESAASAAESSASAAAAKAVAEKEAAAKEHGAVATAKAGAAVKHADLFLGVSCAGAQCVAVGAWYYGITREHTLVELWTGKAWVLEPSPDGPKYSSLTAVSCAPASSATSPGCLALGAPILAGYGSHWRVIASPSDAADLDAVSCTSANACVAVGTGTGTALVFATWNGKTWHAGTMHAPPPQAQQARIAAVSCTAADDCVAVGNYAYGITAMPSPALRDKTLAERWNGRSWSLLAGTVDVSHTDWFTGVSCPAADDCTAVGDNQGQYPLAERWNGKTWRVEPMPTVSSIGYLELAGVSCPAADFCVAAGTYQETPVAETWDGTTWRLTQLPEPPGGDLYTQVNAVSCASSQACVAVGDTVPADTFAEVYAAGKWRLSATRNPT